jgi:hypothetical protein
MKQLLPFLKFQLIGIILLLFSAMETDAQNICVSGNSVTPANTQNICVGSSSTPLVASITTTGSGTAGNITYNWYSNTTNSTSGGTLVQTSSTNTSTTTNSFTPPSTVSGTLWYYAVVTNGGGSCSGTSYTSSAVQVNISKLPQVFTVSGGGARCSNGSSVGVYLSGSETDVNYQLMRDGNPVGSPRKGTGHAMTSLVSSAGTYTIQATRISGSCTTAMAGSATVTINSSPSLTYTKTDVSCNGGDGTVTITGTGGTPGYTFSIDGGSFSTSNTFSGLTSGTHAIAVQDVNSCSATSTVSIQNAAPVTVNIVSVNPGDCSGTSGSITASMVGGVNDGVTPIQYKLDGDVVRPYQSSNVFGGLAKGNYTVTIKDSKGCTGVSSTVSLTQVAGTAPTVFNVTGGGTRCSSSTGLSINLSGSETGVSYQLSKNGLPVGSSISGTGNPIGFVVSDSGAYNIVGTNTTAGCNNVMNGTATVIVNASPNNYTVSGGGTRCSNSAGSFSAKVYLSNSESGVNYQLLRDGLAVGSVRSGTGIGLSYLVSTAGTYTIQATNASSSCITTMSGSAIVAANVNPPITASYTKYYASSCVGGDGTITVTANGGTPSYLYSIDNKTFSSNNNFTGLAAGEHKIIIIDANNCTFTYDSITVLTAPPITPTATTISSGSCTGNDGTVIAHYFGGVVDSITPLQYKLDGDVTRPFQFSNQFDGLPAGNYTVTEKDSKGCTGVSSVVTITQASPLTLVSSGSYQTNVSSCGNGTDGNIVITVTGGVLPFTTTINGVESTTDKRVFGFGNLAPGAYTVVIKDFRGCTLSLNYTINQASAPVAIVAYRGDETCIGANNGYISLSPTNIGGIPPQYHYSKDGGTTYQTSYSFTNLAPGTYSMVVKDSKGCTSAPVSVTIQAATKSCRVGTSNSLRTASPEENLTSKAILNSTLKIRAYPSPSSSEFTLDIAGNNKDKVSIIVTDLLGRRYQQLEGMANQQFKLGRKLNPGVYIVQVSQGDKVETIKIVKE